MCWNRPSRPTTSQLTSGRPWPRTGRPGGQLFARAQTTLRKAVYRAWMKRDQQGRTECQTLALLYLACSAARSALPLSCSKPICANTNTDASSSKSKDYYYYYYKATRYHNCYLCSCQVERLPFFLTAHLQPTKFHNCLSVKLQGFNITTVLISTVSRLQDYCCCYQCSCKATRLLLLLSVQLQGYKIPQLLLV